MLKVNTDHLSISLDALKSSKGPTIFPSTLILGNKYLFIIDIV